MITDVCFFDGYEESTGKSNELKIYSLIEKGKGCLCFFIGDDTKESLKKYAFNTPYEKEIIVETNGRRDRNIIIYLDDNTKLDYTINIIY